MVVISGMNVEKLQLCLKPALIGLGVACSWAPAPAAQEPPATARSPISIEQRFKQYDKNGDGKLDRSELPGALFDRLDANKDGFVTEEEAKALWKNK